MLIPPAASQLISQVYAHDAAATWETVGDPDGFGRYREIKFDADTSAWLAPILKVIQDERIAAMEQRGKTKRLVVCFVPDVRADFRHPFEIEAVDAVLNQPDDEEPEDEGQ